MQYFWLLFFSRFHSLSPPLFTVPSLDMAVVLLLFYCFTLTFYKFTKKKLPSCVLSLACALSWLFPLILWDSCLRLSEERNIKMLEKKNLITWCCSTGLTFSPSFSTHTLCWMMSAYLFFSAKKKKLGEVKSINFLCAVSRDEQVRLVSWRRLSRRWNFVCATNRFSEDKFTGRESLLARCWILSLCHSCLLPSMLYCCSLALSLSCVLFCCHPLKRDMENKTTAQQQQQSRVKC